MKFKKLVTVMVTALILILSPIYSSMAKAEEVPLETQVEILSSGYSEVNAFYNDGGEINSLNVEDLYIATSQAVISAEQIKSQISQDEYNRYYRNMHTDVFRVYKNVLVYKMETSYDESVYAPTDGGIALLHSTLNEKKSLINSATNYETATATYNEFLEFLAGENLALKTSVLSTDAEQAVSVSVQSISPIFSQDDVLETEFFRDSVIIKNTKVALIGNEKLIDETSGVAQYVSIRWKRNGVIMDGNSVPLTEVSISIDVEDLGVEINGDSAVQIVRYLGNRQVDFISNVILTQDNKLTFNLQSFGEDVATQYDLDFAIVIKGYAIESSSVVGKFIEENPFLVLAGVCAIVLLYLIIKIVKSVKARKKRKQYKAFKKYLKKQKKEKKLSKKKKRKKKKEEAEEETK